MGSSSIFGDKRLDREYDRIVTQMAASGCSVINRACTEKKVRKAAYRFVNNENVTVGRIVEDLVRQCVANADALGVHEVLVAQDTMEVVRENIVARLGKSGREVLECARTNKGMRSHSAIVMDASNGEPLGFGYLKIWGRKPKPRSEVKEGDMTADRKRQPSYYMPDPDTGTTRYKYNVPLAERESESSRWIEAAGYVRQHLPQDVHVTMVQDREGDMYPLLCLPAQSDNLDIVVRASKKRKVRIAGGKSQDLFGYTGAQPVAGKVSVKTGKGRRGKSRDAELALRFGPVEILRPHSPVYPRKSIRMHFVRMTEIPAARPSPEPLDWLLLTSLDVSTPEEAAKVVRYYRKRWFIEDYHRLLKKKGFGIEDIQVESPHAFEVNLALSIKSAYEVALVKKGFDADDDATPASLVFTPLELEVVEALNKRFNTGKKIYRNPHPKGSLAWAAWAVACEGGWSAMPSQPKPGLITFKRGIDRLETICQYLREGNSSPTCG